MVSFGGCGDLGGEWGWCREGVDESEYDMSVAPRECQAWLGQTGSCRRVRWTTVHRRAPFSTSDLPLGRTLVVTACMRMAASSASGNDTAWLFCAHTKAFFLPQRLLINYFLSDMLMTNSPYKQRHQHSRPICIKFHKHYFLTTVVSICTSCRCEFYLT